MTAGHVVRHAGASARKLRLLCLHGMYQNAETFKAKTKHLRSDKTDEMVEYIYVDGPFTVTPRVLTRPCSGTQRSASSSSRARPAAKNADAFRAWWRPPHGPHLKEASQMQEDREELLTYLEDTLDRLGEIDGVLGFSQGASLASWMCSAQARVELRWSPKIAVLIGSYVGPHEYNMQSGILSEISSLHMFGSNDHVISASKSQQVVDIFRASENRVLTSIHHQGHVIPKSDAALAELHSFLQTQSQALPVATVTRSMSSEKEEEEVFL